MLKKNIASTIVFISLPLLTFSTLPGCANTYHQESTGQYIDSGVITTKVKAELFADKAVKGRAINVTTYKNVVQLSGFVDSVYQKQRAVAIASAVPGVKEVQDFLVVKKH